MRRSGRALMLGLVIAFFLLAGTGAAFAYGSGNGWTWCGGGASATTSGTAVNSGYRCSVGAVRADASTTVVAAQVVPPLSRSGLVLGCRPRPLGRRPNGPCTRCDGHTRHDRAQLWR